MPRKLPWLAQSAKKKESRPAPAPTRKKSSSPGDLVNSDLDDIDDEPMPKKKKQVVREPSSSPPPVNTGPPPTEYMNEGLAGDDVFMMVEDEFYSTAQSFTKHIHHAEYVRLKKLHRSRGHELLAQLQRGTDNGRTEQSKQLRLKLDAEENRKKQAEMRRLAYGDGGSSDEDDLNQDPQLAGLMTGSQMSASQNLAKMGKGRTSALTAMGSLQSPHKPSRVRDALIAQGSSRQRTESSFTPVDEEDEGEDETDDSDDLDARPSKSQRRYNAWANKPLSDTTRPSIERDDEEPLPPPKERIFKQFTRQSSDDRKPIKEESSPQRDRQASDLNIEESSSPMKPIKTENKYARFFDDDVPTLSRAAQLRAEQAKKEAEKRKAVEDSIPTFLF